MNTQLTTNPFTDNRNVSAIAQNAAAASDQERSLAEVKATIMLAKQFPRDPVSAVDHIIQSCTRPTLAESAVYAFPRGNTTVTGPSIRLAETIAQSWGNLNYGVRELSQENGVSTVETFAWDVQTNVKVVKTFQVRHQRKAHGSIKTLTDPRDIYEMVANQGARRLRACILAVIPGDVTETALRQCQVTLENSVQVDEQSVSALVEAFSKFGVTQEMLSHRLGGKHLNAMIAAEMINLRNIYRSLKDGMAKPGDFFQVPEGSKTTTLSDLKSKGQSPVQEKIVDSNGEEFDPAIHSTGRDGKPVLNQGGSFRARRGSHKAKPEESPAPEQEAPQAQPQAESGVSFAGIAEMLNMAETQNELDSAMRHISGLPDDQKGELRTLAHNKSKLLESE